jgi:hypothetical protein
MTQHVIHISTANNNGCEHCPFSSIGGGHFAESVNHYIEKHDYKLLHVGTESTGTIEAPWLATVAVVGK